MQNFKIAIWVVLVGLFLMLGYCFLQSRPASVLEQMVGRFEGIMPCADCPGIATVIKIAPDGSFEMRESYLDTQTQSVSAGIARISDDSKILILETRRFLIDNKNTIEPLDLQGNKIVTSADIKLRRVVTEFIE
ncbi:MAG: copper resistance protein NlpE [Lactobacillales bacterium]|jgi:hypothetical protein|nr:copper resistance protein NlpE [Lactobacillales bacterium]